MIKTLRTRITVDGRGKISSGRKSENGFPQSLDHFDVTDFPELVAMYGERPDKLLLYFPSDEITDFYDTTFARWGKATGGAGTKVRTCDGETCIHRIDETVGGTRYAAGEESPCVCASIPDDGSEEAKKRCRLDCYFKAFIGDPVSGHIENPSCYMFTTHSQNSAEAIYSELEKIKALNMGSIRGVPFLLSVRMCSGKTDAKQKFPIWSLQVIGLLKDIRERSGKLLGELATPIEGYEQKRLAAASAWSEDMKRSLIQMQEWIKASTDGSKAGYFAKCLELFGKTLKDLSEAEFAAAWSKHGSEVMEFHRATQTGAAR